MFVWFTQGSSEIFLHKPTKISMYVLTSAYALADYLNFCRICFFCLFIVYVFSKSEKEISYSKAKKR